MRPPHLDSSLWGNRFGALELCYSGILALIEIMRLVRTAATTMPRATGPRKCHTQCETA